MTQRFTRLLNQTVTGNINNSNAPQPHSVSVRISNLNQGGYVKLFGITWSVFADNDGNALNDLAHTRLLILKNEVFDPDFNYQSGAVHDKDVIWRDTAIFAPGNPAINVRIVELGRHKNFKPPMKLNDASDYLVIIPAPIRVGDPGTFYRVNLTVRGETYCKDDSNTFAANKR